jgi:hypothetical protein
MIGPCEGCWHAAVSGDVGTPLGMSREHASFAVRRPARKA